MSCTYKKTEATGIKSVLLSVFLSIALAAIVLTAPVSWASCYLAREIAEPAAPMIQDPQPKLPREYVWEVHPVSFDHMYRK